MHAGKTLPVVAVVIAAASHGGAFARPSRAGAQPVPEYTGPRIVVRRSAAPEHYVSDRTVRTAGPGAAIAVPANTAQGGAPLWYTRGLLSADLRLAHATAEWTEAQADRLEQRRAPAGVHSSFLFIDPLIVPWPMGVGSGLWPMPMDAHAGMGGDALLDTDAEGAPTEAPAQPPRPAPAARDDDDRYTGPQITVHRNGAARRDAERTVTRIHLAGGTYTVGTAAAGRAVAVPENTVYAGPPMWYIRGLQTADVRIANATADWVEAKADRARRWNNRRH